MPTKIRNFFRERRIRRRVKKTLALIQHYG